MKRTCNLHVAAFYGDMPFVESLLRSGAIPNAMGYYLGCPLHAAASGGHAEIAGLLADYGAGLDANEEDPDS